MYQNFKLVHGDHVPSRISMSMNTKRANCKCSDMQAQIIHIVNYSCRGSGRPGQRSRAKKNRGQDDPIQVRYLMKPGTTPGEDEIGTSKCKIQVGELSLGSAFCLKS